MMKKVITYGTYDLLHYGHIRLLERAKALGDYLIVGVTADNFDMTRGKINVQQSLIERIESVRETGIADEIIVEEYEGQKIDDIIKYDVDIFTVGSDWKGYFDYLNEYCEVVYLDRTQGISSSELRTETRKIRLGIVGDSLFLNKIETESKFVNGIEVNSIFTKNIDNLSDDIKRLPYIISENYDEFLNNVDAVYIRSKPEFHYKHIKDAILAKKSVLCESPMTLKIDEWEELNSLANENKVVLMNSIKTAYSTAYSRLLLLLKGGKIGKIMSVDSNCTRLEDVFDFDYYNKNWNNIYEWGPTALLPIFQILGTNYKSKNMIAHYIDKENKFDDFVKIDFIYDNAVASMKIGSGVKTEGYLVISGTKGYAYVPAPWWKTDYFELRYEKIEENKRYFYQLDGEGIRYALVAFVKSIESGRVLSKITPDVSKGIIKCMEEFSDSRNVIKI